MIGSALVAGAALNEKVEPAAAKADVIKKLRRERELALMRNEIIRLRAFAESEIFRGIH